MWLTILLVVTVGFWKDRFSFFELWCFIGENSGFTAADHCSVTTRP